MKEIFLRCTQKNFNFISFVKVVVPWKAPSVLLNIEGILEKV